MDKGLLVAIDVGNTHLMAGVMAGDEILNRWRLSTDRSKTEDEYGLFLHQLFTIANIDIGKVHGVVIASVVPPLTEILERLARRYFRQEALMVRPDMDTGIKVCYDNPREVGADRVANAVAAYNLYGGPCVVVDFGTATTVDVVNSRGEYLGGAIAPGIITATEALFAKAARLPRIELVGPGKAICTNTVASMQAGIVYGFAGQVDALVKRISSELETKPTVVATGGQSPLVAAESSTIEMVNLDLTLIGLRIIYERQNCSK